MRTPLFILPLLLLLAGCVANPPKADGDQQPLTTRLEGAERRAFLEDYAALQAKRGNHRKAAQLLEELRRSNPKDSDVIRQLARVYEESGEKELALAARKRVYQLSGDPHDAAEYARVALANERFEQAERIFRQWLDDAESDSPRAVMAMNNLGYTRLLQKDYAGARQWFEKALESDPLHTRARANLELTRRLQAGLEEEESND